MTPYSTPASKRPSRAARQLACLLAGLASSSQAATIYKANNLDTLELGSSWEGGLVPGLADVAVIDSRVAAATSLNLGVNTEYRGLKFEANQPGLIFDTFGSGGTAISLTLGKSGLDLSTATPGTSVLFDSPTMRLRPGTSQTWAVADGVSVNMLGPITATGATLRFNLGSTGTGVLTATGFPSPAFIIPYSTVEANGQVNFATTDLSTLNIIPATDLADPNPSDGGNATVNAEMTAAPASGRYVDVVNSNGLASATAFRVQRTGSGAGIWFNNAGIRFNQPHATEGTNWVVDMSQRILYPDRNTTTILVTPGVGDRDVIFNGGANGNAFRYNNSGAQLLINQLNTQGDVIIRATASARQTGNNFVKGGPGRLIMGNTGHHSASGSTVYLTEGVTQLGENNATGTFGTLPIVVGGTLRLQRSDVLAMSNVISGDGELQIAMTETGNISFTGTNTISGPVSVESGTLTLANATSIGNPTSIGLSGGTVVYGTGVTNDLSANNLTLAGPANINTAANSVVFAQSFGGSGSLTKSGTGTLNLSAANTYEGGTNVVAGTLAATNTTGSATGSGAVTLAGTTTLTGTGSIAGAVTVASGAKLVPGSDGTVGSLTVGGLNLQSGSLLDLDFESLSQHDQLVVTSAGGLTVDGGLLTLKTVGAPTAWSTPGTYNLISYSGAISGTGPSSLSVGNPSAGYAYNFSANGSSLQLEILLDSIITNWTGSGSGSWGNVSNWSAGVPSGSFTPSLGAGISSAATISLDGNHSINGLVLDNTFGYTINAGSGGTLTFQKSSGNAAVNVLAGDHTISAPVALSTTTGITTASGTSLTISGVVSGAGGLIKAGDGALDLTGDNSFSGPLSVLGGVIGFTQANGLGSGAVTLNGGTILFNTGNTTDISGKTVTFGLDGAGIDTNGNDVVFANPVGNSGIGALSKLGNGSLTLASGNTYSGDTYIRGGELIIAENSALGVETLAKALHLNGGTLVPALTLSLDNEGANPRPLAMDGAGGVMVPADVTLTLPGLVTGPGQLTKSGAGTLTITGANPDFTGGVNLAEGTVRISNNSNSLGTGILTLSGTADLYLAGQGLTDNGTSRGLFTNAIHVAADASATIRGPQRGGMNGVLTGSGTLNVAVDGTRFEATGNGAAFTGNLNIIKTPTGDGTDVDDYYMTAAQNLIGAKVRLTNGTQMVQSFNPPNNGAVTTVHNFGELEVDAGAILGGNPVAGRFNNYSVGALNTDFSINGILRGTLNIFGYGYPSLTKNGTGTLTLNNTHLTTGAITVNAGTLKVLGSVERHYTLAGNDGVLGRVIGNTPECDDVITTAAPTTGTIGVDYVNTEPGAVTVAVAGTLAGNGRLGGLITVNGTLRPDATGTLGGNLQLTGIAGLTLASTSTVVGEQTIETLPVTQFDINGTVFTGVKSTGSGAVNLDGELRINQLNGAYNGSYKLFDLVTPAAGSFDSVTILANGTVEVALTNNSGMWTGTTGSVSYSYSEATGTLTIEGGSTAITPAVPAALQAVAGNAQVSLTWNAAADATTYSVKRSTTAGGPYATIATNAATTYTDLAVTNDTTYYYVVQARNAAAASADSSEVSATPSAPTVVYTALQEWRFAQFGVYDDTAEVLAGDTEDFDSDGLANLLEYAVNTNPTVPNASPVAVARSGDFLTLSYPVNADPALTYAVQGSSDLASGFTAGAGTTQTNAGVVTYTDNVSIGAGIRRFLRLIVGYSSQQ